MNEYEKTEEEASQLGKETGAKFDAGKSRWDLMPADILLDIADESVTFKGLYDQETHIKDLRGKMIFHYSNGMEGAWRFWNSQSGSPFSAGTQDPLMFASISYIHLLDLALIDEDDNKMDLLRKRERLYEMEIPNASGFYFMSYRVLNYLGDIYLYGCKKYDENNWRKGMEWGKIFAAFCRHSGQWFNGESYDKESGMHHLGHALWQLLGLGWFQKYKPDFDDRWKN